MGGNLSCISTSLAEGNYSFSAYNVLSEDDSCFWTIEANATDMLQLSFHKERASKTGAPCNEFFLLPGGMFKTENIS